MQFLMERRFIITQARHARAILSRNAEMFMSWYTVQSFKRKQWNMLQKTPLPSPPSA